MVVQVEAVCGFAYSPLNQYIINPRTRQRQQAMDSGLWLLDKSWMDG